MPMDLSGPRVKRLAYVVIGLLLLLWLRNAFSGDQHGHREALQDAPISRGKLISDQIAELDHHFSTPLVGLAVAQAEGGPGRSYWPNFAVVGTPAFLLDVFAHTLHVGAEPVSARPVMPWRSHVTVESVLGYSVVESASAVDTQAGAVRTFERFGDQQEASVGFQQIVRTSYVAHRDEPNTIVQEIFIANPSASELTVRLKRTHSDMPGVLIDTNELKLPSTSGTGPNGWPIQFYLTSLKDKYAVVALTACPATAVIEPRTDLRWNIVTAYNFTAEAVQEGLTSSANIAASKLPEAVQDAIRHMSWKLSSERASSFTLRRHEASWVSSGSANMLVSGFPQIGQSVSLAIYYVRTMFANVALPNTPESQTPCSGPKAATCYGLPPTRNLEFWQPLLPHNLLEIDAFIGNVLRAMQRGCCRPATGGALVDSIIRSFMSIESDATNLRIAPSWDLPETATVLLEGLTFNEHILSVRFGEEQLSVSRTDMISESLYAIGGGINDIVQLKPRVPQVFDEGTCYISTVKSSLSDVQRKDATRTAEAAKRRPYRMPRWTVVAIFVIIFLFHVVLVKLVYTEYCATPDPLPYRK
eukprot:m.170391 g.170391  ORF g.170391 m.170391 type:complete len:586 (-) comp17249_c0_seq2:2067-3824(-)